MNEKENGSYKMKKHKFRNWLIKKLGGYTEQNIIETKAVNTDLKTLCIDFVMDPYMSEILPLDIIKKKLKQKLFEVIDIEVVYDKNNEDLNNFISRYKGRIKLPTKYINMEKVNKDNIYD